MFGNSKKQKQNHGQITGQDMLLVIAAEMQEAGVPNANRFSLLLTEMLTPRPGGPLFGHEAAAIRPLEEHEAVPFTAMCRAVDYCVTHQDWESLKEVAVFGANASARWARFLASTADGHPTMDIRPPEGGYGFADD